MRVKKRKANKKHYRKRQAKFAREQFLRQQITQNLINVQATNDRLVKDITQIKSKLISVQFDYIELKKQLDKSKSPKTPTYERETSESDTSSTSGQDSLMYLQTCTCSKHEVKETSKLRTPPYTPSPNFKKWISSLPKRPETPPKFTKTSMMTTDSPTTLLPPTFTPKENQTFTPNVKHVETSTSPYSPSEPTYSPRGSFQSPNKIVRHMTKTVRRMETTERKQSSRNYL